MKRRAFVDWVNPATGQREGGMMDIEMDTPTPTVFGEDFRQKRIELEVRLNDFAQAMGVQPVYVSGVERGKTTIGEQEQADWWFTLGVVWATLSMDKDAIGHV
jgi:hypothetical protein